MKKTGKDILTKALSILKREGARVWIKGEDYANDRRGPRRYQNCRPEEADCYCARGLVSKLAGRSEAARGQAMRLLSDAIPLGASHCLGVEARVTGYNDNDGRTFYDMVRWFKRALETA